MPACAAARARWLDHLLCGPLCVTGTQPTVCRRAQLRMGPRVVGLLWELTMAPGAPPEVARGSQLVGALMAYACRGADGIALVWDYLGRCVAQARRPAFARHTLTLNPVAGRSRERPSRWRCAVGPAPDRASSPPVGAQCSRAGTPCRECPALHRERRSLARRVPRLGRRAHATTLNNDLEPDPGGGAGRAQVKANKGAAAALKVLQLLMGQLARQKLAQQLEVQVRQQGHPGVLLPYLICRGGGTVIGWDQDWDVACHAGELVAGLGAGRAVCLSAKVADRALLWEVQEAMLRMEKTYNLQEVVIGSLEARARARRRGAGSPAGLAGPSAHAALRAAGGAGLDAAHPAGARTPH